MKTKRTGTMVSFTMGFCLGIYATSDEGKNWLKKITNKLFGRFALNPPRKRNIIDLRDESSKVSVRTGWVQNILRKIKTHFLVSARKRIIQKNTR